MADSRRETIIEAVETALSAVGKPTGFTVHRHRLRPLDIDDLPAAIVFNGVERIERQTSAPPIMDRELVFRVEVRGEGEPTDEILDPYLNWVETTLMTNAALLALIREIELRQIIWDQAPAKKARAAAALEFAVKYRTTYGDPTTVAP